MSISQTNSPSPKKVIFDTDGGGDDLWALLLLVDAHQRGEIELLGVTTCYGNVPLDKASNNVLNFLYHCSVSYIPVFKGAEKTLSGLTGLADDAFGETGLSKGALPKSDQDFSPISADQFLKETLENTTDDISIVATGPATNIARVFKDNPELDKDNINLTWFGGAVLPANGNADLIVLGEDAKEIFCTEYNRGNITHAMEFNAGNDVPAAKIVTNLKNVSVTIVPMDQCQHTVFSPDNEKRLIAEMNKNDQADVAQNLIAFLHKVKELDQMKQGMNGTPVYDAQTAQHFFNPELFVDTVPLKSVDFVEKEHLVPAFIEACRKKEWKPELLENHGAMSVTPIAKTGVQSNIRIVAGPYTFADQPSKEKLNDHIEMGQKRANDLVARVANAAQNITFQL